MNLGLSEVSKDVFYLFLDPSHEYLYDSARVEVINAEIRKLGVNVLIKAEIKKHDIQTPAQRMLRLREEKLQAAERAITDDPTVQALQEKFGATLVKESIRLRE
jgi:DNA polymerase-3 subunit gamma/tau